MGIDTEYEIAIGFRLGLDFFSHLETKFPDEYKEVPQFDPDTGEPIKSKKKLVKHGRRYWKFNGEEYDSFAFEFFEALGNDLVNKYPKFTYFLSYFYDDEPDFIAAISLEQKEIFSSSKDELVLDLVIPDNIKELEDQLVQAIYNLIGKKPEGKLSAITVIRSG